MDGSSTSGGRGRTATAADAATGLSAARSGGSSEVRLCGSYAYVLRMYMHLTAYHPFLTDSGDHGTGRTSPKHHFLADHNHFTAPSYAYRLPQCWR